jgi:hypothetical protein
VSPTAPTFATLNDQLNKAHRRIRELQARETELLAQNRTLCAVITELTHDDHAQSATHLSSSPLHTPSPNDGSDGRFGISDQVGSHTSKRPSPAERSSAPAKPPELASASGTGTARVKTRRFPHV